ncbi:MAG: Spy/CpxP family protein refolding chaperone [Rhodopseudomonas sp.]|uniref:Spy/CpxP family protein refolding chaperone n=1 Tax=Rhodopseudomonas sp. TaxID=1078 RepID=UPI00181D71B9|nr:Spy/CpxP family protein refolding chaperone [Rhodopseudomonas sp.]NVN88609.1 Spy/CpxP family protein refolding chaperone [Rhodopseudomonas sp.]
MPTTSMSQRRRSLSTASGLAMLALLITPAAGLAQGLVQGVEQGARAGNKAAGPVGGVLGGAIGGFVGVVGGVLGGVTGNNARGPVDSSRGPAREQPAATAPKQTKAEKAAERAAERAANKAGVKAAKPTPPPAPVALTAEQIVATSDANIERIKAELKLTPEQEKHWGIFSSAMHYLGQHGADRLNLRNARALRDPPDDIIEQMRNEAQFLVDRAADQRAVADGAEPLFASLDAKQKAIFIAEMVGLSRERGLD